MYHLPVTPQSVLVTSMTFQQAQDGDLHIIVFPSVEASTATYPVYLRENKPQRRMEVRCMRPLETHTALFILGFTGLHSAEPFDAAAMNKMTHKRICQ